jgi:hypothetical protein
MTANYLLQLVLRHIKIEKVHPLHEAMLEECCENVIQSDMDHEKEKLMIGVVILAFTTSESIMRASLKSTMQAFDGDQITLNYRNQVFLIQKDSAFLK